MRASLPFWAISASRRALGTRTIVSTFGHVRPESPSPAGKYYFCEIFKHNPRFGIVLSVFRNNSQTPLSSNLPAHLPGSLYHEMDQFALKGKTAVITGGARGLGFAFAEALAEAGASIAILDIGTPKPGSLEELAERCGVQIKSFVVDVSSREQVNEVIETIEREFGSVDVNVNAAGVVTDESFLTTSDQNLSRTFNFIGSFLVAQACANAMVRNDVAPIGSIIFISSVSVHVSTVVQQTSCYIASKSAVRGLVKPLALELAQYGIRVNTLSPGSTRTDMFKQVEEAFPDLVKQFNQESMFGRVAEPRELKPAILFLATSSWTTGQDLVVDGGMSSFKHRANY
ncbi:NAD(P)-binding protein [Aspergillus sclerotioniger CBS 115572]|uniref:NAD(P)-binding protein n=1 Tax=Aspergillus sclerotioniger CBS 115572 TaxID=1450535 RepID=A0A317XCH8_9EURO|nr:NAD(P)-binding protein [Aspergillus sclerotioniger CBS 115572]PWY95412.1 NAD(P)-binding protein [Aspergillus sclerotioniger CBS 115572]